MATRIDIDKATFTTARIVSVVVDHSSKSSIPD